MRPGELEVGSGDKAVSIRRREERLSGLILIPVQQGEEPWENGKLILMCRANPRPQSRGCLLKPRV